METPHPATRSRRVLLGAALSAVVVAVAACGSNDDENGTTATARNVPYVESIHLTPGQNSVLGYARAADGGLTPVPGSPFLTGGEGHNNPTAGEFGPNDIDRPTGTLAAVAGFPFPSGGRNPVSVEIAGNRLYVVNKSEDAGKLRNADVAERHRLHDRVRRPADADRQFDHSRHPGRLAPTGKFIQTAYKEKLT